MRWPACYAVPSSRDFGNSETPTGRSPAPDPTGSLRHGHQLEHVAVRVLEVDAPAAVPIVELAVVETPRRAAVSDAGFLHAAEDCVEFGVAHVEGVVMAFERRVVVEQERQRLIHPHRREMVARPGETQAEKAREIAGGGHLVARRHNGVVEHDRHGRTSLPGCDLGSYSQDT